MLFIQIWRLHCCLNQKNIQKHGILGSMKTWVFPKIDVPPNHPILIGFGTIINHPCWWFSPYFWVDTQIIPILLPWGPSDQYGLKLPESTEIPYPPQPTFTKKPRTKRSRKTCHVYKPPKPWKIHTQKNNTQVILLTVKTSQPKNMPYHIRVILNTFFHHLWQIRSLPENGKRKPAFQWIVDFQCPPIRSSDPSRWPQQRIDKRRLPRGRSVPKRLGFFVFCRLILFLGDFGRMKHIGFFLGF